VDRDDARAHEYSPAAGQSFSILAAGETRRGEARLYCVTDGAHDPAWVFLAPDALAGCPAFE
jgi:hypothetical protein